jgi:hypothetical protein
MLTPSLAGRDPTAELLPPDILAGSVFISPDLCQPLVDVLCYFAFRESATGSGSPKQSWNEPVSTI